MPTPRSDWGGKASLGSLGVPAEGTGGTLWQRHHSPGMLAGEIPAHSFISITILPTEDMQLSQLTRVLHFALVFRTTGEAELCPILPPPRSPLPPPQHRLQLSQVTKSHSFFFSFPLLSQEVGVGGDWQGAVGKDAQKGCPCPSPGRLDRCHRCGQQDSRAGQDGGGLLQVGAEVGWV